VIVNMHGRTTIKIFPDVLRERPKVSSIRQTILVGAAISEKKNWPYVPFYRYLFLNLIPNLFYFH
jgi:hypothetical protein